MSENSGLIVCIYKKMGRKNRPIFYDVRATFLLMSCGLLSIGDFLAVDDVDAF